MPTVPTTTTRIARLIGKLTRSYQRRKAAGRRVDHLVRRCGALNLAYTAARDSELNA